jgi:hypothetical protein
VALVDRLPKVSWTRVFVRELAGELWFGKCVYVLVSAVWAVRAAWEALVTGCPRCSPSWCFIFQLCAAACVLAC